MALLGVPERTDSYDLSSERVVEVGRSATEVNTPQTCDSCLGGNQPPAAMREKRWLVRFHLRELRRRGYCRLTKRDWSEAFARSGDRLRELAKEAVEEHDTGRTTTLDPDRL